MNPARPNIATIAKAEPSAASPMAGLAQLAPGPGGFDLLDGVKVLDLTTSIAGPFATMLLADMGAEVFKIERPGLGDDSRGWGPPFLDGESLWYLSVNRNKQSVAIDYASPRGHAALRELARACDIVVVNQPPRVAEKLSVDPVALHAANQRLIYVSITGFGLKGERSAWTCYDLIAEGYSGIMDLTGEPGDDPQKIGTPAADMLAGQDAAFAAVSALFARQKNGAGRVIDIALVDSMTRFLTCRIVPYLGSGEVPRRSGGRDSVIAIYQAFETADEPITLGLGNDGLWRRFWQALGAPEIGDRPEYATNADRRSLRPEIVKRIQAHLLGGTRSHWLDVFRAARIPAGPINRIDQIAADAELHKRGMFYAIDDGERVIPQVGTAIQIDGRHNTPRAAPPRLGEHTADVLKRVLGYDDATIAALTESGIGEQT